MGDKRLKRQLVTNHSLLATERKAFTLIELLVVISVIAVLMAVLLPVLGRVRKQAKSVVCKANLRQWGIAFSAYVGDHDGRMPGYVGAPRLDDLHQWFFPLKAYGTEYEDRLLCPATSPRHVRGQGPSFRLWWYRRKPFPEIVGSYGYNGWLAGQSYDRAAGHAGIPVVFDCSWYHIVPEHYHDPPEYEGHFGRGQAHFYITRVCLNRHNGGINILFRDWSVRKVGLKELWTLKWHPEFETSGPWTVAGGVQPEDWPKWMRRFKEY